jgi:hypothetical protein
MRIMRAGMLALVAAMLCGTAAEAGETSNPNGRFSIWLPDPWTVTQKRSGIVAENPKHNIYMVASPVVLVDADSLDEAVRTFVDNELDDAKITKDDETKHQGFAARRLQGTGRDEGDDVIFQCIVIDPGNNRDPLAVLIYGDPKPMEEAPPLEKILGSLKPL